VDDLSLAHPARPTEEGQSYRYPTPLELARERARREPTPTTHGAIGGLTTLTRYGVDHYRHMARLSWMGR
jgi:hypothetical protein